MQYFSHCAMPAMDLWNADGCSRAGEGSNDVNMPPSTAQRRGNETVNCRERNETTSKTEEGGGGDSQTNNTTLPSGGAEEGDKWGDGTHEEEMEDFENGTDYFYVNCENSSDQQHLCSSDEKARQLCLLCAWLYTSTGYILFSS